MSADLNQAPVRMQTRLIRQKVPVVPRVHRVRRVLFPSRAKRPEPRPEPDLVQRGLLLLWALVCLQVYYTEDTELQSQGPEPPDPEPQEGALTLGTADGGAGVELWWAHDQRQCVKA